MCIKSYFHLKGRGKINHGEKETQSKFKGLSLTRQTSEYSLEYQELQTVKPRILGEGLAHCPPPLLLKQDFPTKIYNSGI